MTVDTFEGGKYVRASDYDALAARLAEVGRSEGGLRSRLDFALSRYDGVAARLAEAEALLRRWHNWYGCESSAASGVGECTDDDTTTWLAFSEIDELKARLAESKGDSDQLMRRYIEAQNDNSVLKARLEEMPIAVALIKTWREQCERAEARLSEAEAIIADLCAHEGAEGWSQDLNERLARFSATDSASVCPVCYGMGVQKMDDGEPRPCVKCNGRRTSGVQK